MHRLLPLHRGTAFAFVVALVLAGCASTPKPPLDATEPIAERDGDTLVVRWSTAPTDADLPIYAGPSPDAIDSSTPVARLKDGRAEIGSLPFDSRPYLEIELPGGERLALAERQLPLSGMDNFRDLGGYRTTDGRRVRWGRIYRSGQLSELTDSDVDYLDDLGIRLVCDFRSAKEKEREPDRLPTQNPPTVIEPEIMTPGVDPAELQARIMSGDVGDLDLPGFLVEGNRNFVNEFGHRYREMFDHLLEEGGLPAVVHCTAGKDRAGMASALILLSVGVPEETVMQDFLLTNHYTRDKVQKSLAIIWISSLFRTKPTDVKPLMGVEERYLEAGFAAMREKNGSIDTYLRETLGLTDEKRERLRQRLLEPSTRPDNAQSSAHSLRRPAA